MKIIAHLTSNDTVILVGLGKRLEVHKGHEKYNEVMDAMRDTDQSRLEALVAEIESATNQPKIEYTATNSTLTINVEGEEPLMIGKFDIRFNKVKEALEAKNWSRVTELIKPENALEGTGFELRDKVIYYQGDALPEAISKRLIDLIIRGMQLDSVTNFWKKLKANPSFNVRKQLFGFLMANNVPLSENGNFIAYKKVRSDFKDIHSNSMDNSVGQVVKMDRSLVDDNPNNTCSSGLHVCSFDYLEHFGSTEGNKVVLCSVSPEHCVSVPNDYNNSKMRCCEYTVLEEMHYVAPLNKPVYESDESFDNDDFEHDDESFTDAHGYSEELRDEVNVLFNEYSGRYSGNALVTRILEDLEDSLEFDHADEETVEQILVDEGHSGF